MYIRISTYIHTDTLFQAGQTKEDSAPVFCHRASMDMVGSKECKHSISTRMAHSWALGKKKGLPSNGGDENPQMLEVIYIYIHTHIYTHTYIYIYTHITIHIYIHNVYIYMGVSINGGTPIVGWFISWKIRLK